MACGYAMYTDKLGFCFATAGPGAFNLFSGLAVAMSDSYPVLAVSGYASLEWRGKGSLNETSGVNRTPDSQAMFAATTKKSLLLTDIADTLRRARGGGQPRLRGPARAGAHPRPGEPHPPRRRGDATTATCVSRSSRSCPIRRASPRSPTVLADAIAKGKKVVALVGFGAIRSGAGAEVRRLIERFQIPLLTTLDGKGIVAESHPLCGRRVLRQRPRQRLEGVPRGRRRARRRQLAQPARHVQLPRRTCSTSKTLIHINISETRSTRPTRPTTRWSPTPSGRVAALVDALETKVGPRAAGRASTAATTRRSSSLPRDRRHPPRRARAGDRAHAAAARHPAGRRRRPSRLARLLRRARGRARTSARPGTFGPMAGHVNGAIGAEARASRPRRGRRLRRRLLLAVRLRADDRRRSTTSRSSGSSSTTASSS